MGGNQGSIPERLIGRNDQGVGGVNKESAGRLIRKPLICKYLHDEPEPVPARRRAAILAGNYLVDRAGHVPNQEHQRD